MKLILKWEESEKKEEIFNLESSEIDENYKQEFLVYNQFTLKANSNEQIKFILKDHHFSVIPKEIQDYLSKHIFQEGLSKKYKILKRIGKGAFANVIFQYNNI